ncbi:rRNA methyltransferase 1, mitochondrial isoform X2 [Ictalurus punctatus]|uniref:rRNA methyltransferase 1, mitochondrial n=1 Tax=Ictalurus punctatus TaxID=7998 RepID=A0A9F7RD55_ICTPU|nr:rRNA methyltransferase 1, mitochondrial isoform X2 [Ictalurus punctatus]
MWRTAYRFSDVIKTNTNLESLTFLFPNCIQHALYHNSQILFCPKDTGFKVTQRVRRNPFKSSGHLSRIVRPSGKSSGPDRGSGPERRASSELQKLSLEDLRKPEPEPPKLPKRAKDRVINTRLQRENQDELVFGVAPCLLALTQGKRKLTQLFVKRSEGRQRESVEKVCEEAVRRGVPIKHISKREMEKMIGGAVHQGLCLQASPLSFLTKEKSSSQQGNWRSGNPCPLWLVLDGVQDPMNLGTVLRLAYFLGVDRVASSIRNSCPLTPVVSKASSGVMELMDVYGYENLADIVKIKHKQGWQAIGTICAGETSSGVSIIPCSDFKMSKPTLLLMGGEGFGLSPELRELCDVFLTVPPRRELHPAVDSLNISVATGILLHSLLLSCRTGQ